MSAGDTSAAADLYAAVIRPVERIVGSARQLVIVPDVRLAETPFAALYDADARRYLIERVPVALAASAGTLREGAAPSARRRDGRDRAAGGERDEHRRASGCAAGDRGRRRDVRAGERDSGGRCDAGRAASRRGDRRRDSPGGAHRPSARRGRAGARLCGGGGRCNRTRLVEDDPRLTRRADARRRARRVRDAAIAVARPRARDEPGRGVRRRRRRRRDRHADADPGSRRTVVVHRGAPRAGGRREARRARSGRRSSTPSATRKRRAVHAPGAPSR